jgi:hypothetical protein
MRVVFDYIFDWLPFGFGVPILIGAAFALLGDEFREYKGARACFYIATAWIYGKVFMWAYFTSEKFHIRAIVALLVYGLVGLGLQESLRLTRRREVSSRTNEMRSTESATKSNQAQTPPTEDQAGLGPVAGMSDSVSTVTTPATPRGGAMTGHFVTSGRGEYEIDILGVPPKTLLFTPPGTVVDRNELPMSFVINGHRIAIRKFTARGFVIFDNGWRDIPIEVRLLAAMQSPHSDLLPQIASDVGEIKKQVVPNQRTLTAAQHDKIVELLRNAGKFELAVRHTEGNAEAQRYADMFSQAITDSGWTLRRPKFLIPEKETLGVWVMVQDREHPPDGASQLLEALRAAGIDAQGVEVPALNPGTFDLVIGLPK